jgi:hypothetical protein
MNKKLILAVLAFTFLAGALSYGYIQNNIDAGSSDSNIIPDLATKMVVLTVENKTVILQDGDNYSITNAVPSLFSPLVVAGLGLALVASVPIALKILNYHSKKQLEQNKK